jgi:hypothetical protein
MCAPSLSGAVYPEHRATLGLHKWRPAIPVRSDRKGAIAMRCVRCGRDTHVADAGAAHAGGAGDDIEAEFVGQSAANRVDPGNIAEAPANALSPGSFQDFCQ